MKSCIIFCLLLITGVCEGKEPLLLLMEGVEMTIPYQIQVGAKERGEEKRLQEAVSSTFKEIDAIYNNWNPHSEISRFNQQPMGKPFPLSQALYDFLLLCQYYVTLSEGRFDPTVNPLLKLWKAYLQQSKEPSKQEIEITYEKIGWRHLLLEEQSLTKLHEGVELDLGGIAKGHGVDLMVERLNQVGFNHIYVNWGGEIKTQGFHPEGREWRVAVRFWDPPQEGVIAMKNQALATSGHYMQYWEVGKPGREKRYSHIIEISKKQPVAIYPHSIASVSVLCDSCLKADILATCGIVFDSPQKAKAWFKKQKKALQPLDYWIFTHEKDSQIKGSL